MATEQYLSQDLAHSYSLKKNGTSLDNWKSESATVDPTENNRNDGFDCNICLDSVQDPVITLCGHLYCWPCIYKWIHYQSVSTGNQEKQQPQCPVCKTEVSQQTLVPLYGRSQTKTEGSTPHLGLVIPKRPSSPRCGVHTPISGLNTTTSLPDQQLRHRVYPQLQPTNVVHPTIGMLGEMVYARVFGNSETTLYSYPNTYDLAGISSPRVRRHVMQADKALSRLCFFLCCCMVLCLLLF
ncbi:hypothetical protein LguiA_035174 [Lonicera macranthoides]